jgi:hypothetical protein
MTVSSKIEEMDLTAIVLDVAINEYEAALVAEQRRMGDESTCMTWGI